MSERHRLWLAGGVILIIFLALLGIWLLLRRADDTPAAQAQILGVPPGEVAVSLTSLGLVSMLALAHVFDAKVAATLFGAHVGYHAAASRKS